MKFAFLIICVLMLLYVIDLTELISYLHQSSNRNPPNVRDFTIPESSVRWLFAKINKFLLRFYDISTGKDFSKFFMVFEILASSRKSAYFLRNKFLHKLYRLIGLFSCRSLPYCGYSQLLEIISVL